MLTIMRSGLKSRGFKAIIFVFIALAVGSMVLSDVGGFFRDGNFGRNVVAKIGDTELSLPAFDQTYRQTLQQAQLPPEQAQAIKLPLIVLQQEVSRQLVMQAAKITGVVVSEKTVANLVAEQVAQIKGPETPAEKLQNALRQMGLSEAALVAQMRNDLSQNIFQQASQYAVKNVPPILPQAQHALQTESRQALMVPLRLRDMPAPKTPDDNVLKAFYEENASRYRTPESRDVDVFILSQKQMAREATLSADDMAARTKTLYADNADSFKKDGKVLPFDKVQAELVKQATAEAMDDYLLSLNKNLDQSVAEGMSLTDIAKEYKGQVQHIASVSPSKLAALNLGDKTTNKLKEAASTLGMGETSSLIDTADGGLLLLQVSKITPSALPAFAEKRQAVLDDFLTQARQDAVGDLADKLISAYDAKKPQAWQDLAKQKGLTVATLPSVTRAAENAQVPRPVQDLLFSLTTKSPISTAQVNGETMLVFLHKTTVGQKATPQDIAKLHDQLANSWSQDALQSSGQAWENIIPTQMNQDLITQTYLLPKTGNN